VPKSRVRQKAVYTPPPPKTSARKTSAPWVAPTFIGLLLLGLVWIVLYYATNNSIPGMSTIGGWNLMIGFALIIGGVAMSTQWR
jgi:membrane protease YdiL (CAAX protease family)